MSATDATGYLSWQRLLIHFIKERPVLYDHREGFHRNAQVRNEAFREVAESLRQKGFETIKRRYTGRFIGGLLYRILEIEPLSGSEHRFEKLCFVCYLNNHV